MPILRPTGATTIATTTMPNGRMKRRLLLASIGQPKTATPSTTVARDHHYVPPVAASQSHQSYAPQERDYEDDAPADEGGRYFSGPAAAFSGFGGDTDAYERDELSTALPARAAPGRAVATHQIAHDEYESDDPEYHDGEGYSADDYFDEAPAPRRRNGLLVIMAVLALTVIGTAGAFGYRAMFGGSVLPTLPPIIKAGNGPNKIVPAHGDSQANNSAQPGAANSGSAEKSGLARGAAGQYRAGESGAARGCNHSDHHRGGFASAGRRRARRAGAGGRCGCPEFPGSAACGCRAGPGVRGAARPSCGSAEENPHGHHQGRPGGCASAGWRAGAGSDTSLAGGAKVKSFRKSVARRVKRSIVNRSG